MYCFSLKLLVCCFILIAACSCSLFNRNASTLVVENYPIDSSLGCPYDSELLGLARLSMSEKHYQQALQQSASVLLCIGQIGSKTLTDIYRMRAEAYAYLYAESQSQAQAVANDSAEQGLELLLASLNEYLRFYGVADQYDIDISSSNTESVRHNISALVVEIFEKAMVIKDKTGVEPAVAVFEVLAQAVDSLGSEDKALANIASASGEMSGRFYMERRDLQKAKKYFNLAAKQLQRPSKGAEAQSASLLSDRRVSQLFYNLGGLYYKEFLDLKRVSQFGGSASTLDGRAQMRSLAMLADEYFRLSYQYDPNNVSAVRASKSLE